MKKFAVFSGFLGSGKTTAMMALTEYYSSRFGKAAMISNDLGHGVSLADNRYARLCGCSASEMTEECICYQNENLAQRLNRYYEDGFELVLSDIPGFGVGALEHVYHGLTEKFPGQFELAPFTVLVEPDTVDILRSGQGGDLEYLYDTQLKEADLILLNKCDLIGIESREADLAWLSDHYPLASVLPISALKKQGLEALALALRDGSASMRRPDIGYGGERFMKAMGHMTEYYLQYHAVVCCNDFDGTRYLSDLGHAVQDAVKTAGQEIPHLKLLAWTPEGDFGKVDLLGTGKELQLTRAFRQPCTDLAVILNASADCPSGLFEELMGRAVETVSDRYQLELSIFKRECFGMGD